MSLHLIRKLEQFTRLSADDKHVLEQAASQSIRVLKPGEDVMREGEKPRQVNLILDGWACRYKHLEDGRRQILAFLIPGDVCDPRMFILEEMDHSMGAITALQVAEIPGEGLVELTHHFPRVRRALWWSSLVEDAIAREWIANIGQRQAIERMAHLFCELFIRLRAVGLTNGSSCPMPVTQEQLADATGMSTVHVNRTLQEMRDTNLIALKGKTLTIPDLDVLQSVAMFNPNYLHLDHEGRELDANEG